MLLFIVGVRTQFDVISYATDVICSDVIRTGSVTCLMFFFFPRIFANVLQIQYNACVEDMPKVGFSLLNRQLK